MPMTRIYQKPVGGDVERRREEARPSIERNPSVRGHPSSPQPSAVLPIDRPTLSGNTIRSMIIARRARCRHLPGDLFADPAWDMLLELLEGEIVHRHLSITDLCAAAAVPPTTALRWLNRLEERGMVLRRSDPHDRRRVFIELAPQTSRALYLYFAELFTPVV